MRTNPIAQAIADKAVVELRGLQHPRELALLLQLVDELRPRVVLEIGTRTGATLWAFSRVTPSSCALVSVDPTNQRRFLPELIGQERELHLVTGRSQEPSTLIAVERCLDGRPVDFLFVDGDHTRQAVERDLELYGPLVSPGGLVALHDIRTYAPELNCAVGAVWSRYSGLAGSLEIVDPDGIPAYGIGVLQARALSTLDGGTSGARAA